MKKIIVVGLGNPILGDDGIGWKVAEQVKQTLPADTAITVACYSLGGISLMEHLLGFGHVILVDAIVSGEYAGSVLTMRLGDMPNYSAYHTTSPHDTSLQNALQLGHSLGADLPEDIRVVGVTILPIHEFSEQLSPPVAAALPQAVEVVLQLLEELSAEKEESLP